MKPLILCSIGRAVTALDTLTSREGIEVRRIPLLPAVTSLDAERATVILVDRALVQSTAGDLGALTALAAQAALLGVGEPGETEPPDGFPTDLLCGFIAADSASLASRVAVQGALRHAAALVAARRAVRLEDRSATDVHELTKIGVALSTERDLLALLELILSQARRLSAADAGSLYLIQRNDPAPASLRFKLSQNHTLPNLPFSEFEIPIDHTSLAGYAASTSEPLIIPDVYLLPDNVSYKQNRSFDEKFGYRTRSMLVIPMRTHLDEVIGVLQLINRKRTPDARLSSPEVVDREVLPFDTRSVDLVTALASQAAVAIENGRLYEDIERLFGRV